MRNDRDINHEPIKNKDSAPHKLEKRFFFHVESPLLKYARNVASQNGEDGILEHIFSVLPPSDKYHCVELGAWDGKYLSNCYNLAQSHNWHCLFIEANDKKFEDLLFNHGNNANVTCLKRFVEFDGENRLDNLIAEADFPADLDLLSIDIDGAEYFIWESVERFNPKVVVIEFNPSVPNDVIFVQAKNMSINQGASLLALIELGKQKGYELVCATSCNAIFVLKKFFPIFGLRSNHIAVMYSPDSDGRIFHGYDSYIYVTGMPILIWSDTPVSSDDFQLLPQHMRKFGDAQSK